MIIYLLSKFIDINIYLNKIRLDISWVSFSQYVYVILSGSDGES